MQNTFRNVTEFSSNYYSILVEVLPTCYVLPVYRYSQFLRGTKTEITDTWEQTKIEFKIKTKIKIKNHAAN
jgi:hypothetical protein